MSNLVIVTTEDYAAGNYPEGVPIGVVTSGIATGKSGTK